jgi:molybdopterin-containing oxidoreductase family iron-sulfur binding subunit
MNSDTDGQNSRRSFLQKLGLLSVGTASSFLLSDCSSPSEEGEKVRVLSADNRLLEVDRRQLQNPEKSTDVSYLHNRGRAGLAGKKWVMVIDLAKCKNARKCMKACQAAHQLKPEQHHINVLQMEEAVSGSTYFMPKPCQHCDNPPCVSVCPVDATFKRRDGIVLIDNERCIGCRFCGSLPVFGAYFQLDRAEGC